MSCRESTRNTLHPPPLDLSTSRPLATPRIDLDVEGGGSAHYAAFVTQIRAHASGASKKYYVTAAPQCPFPDANLGAVINAVGFDAVYVQFCESLCALCSVSRALGLSQPLFSVARSCVCRSTSLSSALALPSRGKTKAGAGTGAGAGATT